MKHMSHPFSHDEWFDPEQVRAMGAAFDHACASLELDVHQLDHERGATLVAQMVVQVAQRGERDAARLYDIVMLRARTT